MASALMRRSALTAALAAAATVASPLATQAFAAATAPAESSASPSGTSAANRPTITVTFNAPIASESAAHRSTLALYLGSDRTSNLCGPAHVNSATITCTPRADLSDGKSYQYVASAYDAATDSAQSAAYTGTFTTDIPSLKSIDPSDGAVVGSGSYTVKAVYDEAIADAPTSYITITDSRSGNMVKGGSISASGPLPNSAKDTISYTPPALPAGTYNVHVHVEAPGNSASYADTFINYTVNPLNPTAAPTVAVAGFTPDGGATHWINSGNGAAVPFSGTAQPNFRVAVIVYDASSAGKFPPNCAIGQCTNDRMATVGVADCGHATCAWSLTVNTSVANANSASGTPDKAYNYWIYAYGASGAAVDNGTRPVITKDTVAPAPPNSTSADAAGNSLHVTATHTDTAVYSYKVVVTDAVGQTTVQDHVAPNATKDLDHTFDVSMLEDGESTQGASSAGSSVAPALSIDTFAYDQAGNLSIADLNGPASADKEGKSLAADFANSFVTVNGGTLPFDSINNKFINTPTSITIRFNELIRSSGAQGSNKPPIYTTNLRVLDRNGFPVSGSPAVTGDQRQLTWTLSSSPTDAGSPYTIQDLAAVAGSCPDSGATAGNCEEWPNDAHGTATSGVLSTFFIDNTAPSVHVLSVNGATPANSVTVDATDIAHTVISGTADNDTSTITLAIKPATGSTVIVESDSVAVTHPASGAATWQTSPLNLTALPDGALTVTGSATDRAGNHSAIDAATQNPDGTSRSASTLVRARPSAPQNLNISAGNGHAVLVWAAPASTGGHPLTGYSLSVTDKSVPGSAAAVSAISPTATSYTVSNLSNGHTYALALSAANDIGSGPAVAKLVTPKGNTALSLTGPAHGATTYGSVIALGGRLTYVGVGVAGKAITITSTYYNGSRGPTYHVTTDQNGNYGVAGLKPLKNITYVASYAGDVAYNASSHVTGVLVRVAIKISKVTARSTSHTSPVTLSGSVAPNFRGNLVYIYEVRNGNLVKLGTAKLSSKSTWVFAHTFSKGKHFVIAKFFGRSGNATNQTGQVKIVRS